MTESAAPPPADHDDQLRGELLAERARIVARIAEIDALLGDRR